MNGKLLTLVLLFAGPMPAGARAEEPPAYDRKEDVVYGRKYGTALTMDVFTPRANANGAAVIWVVSGGWFSGHEAISTGFLDELLQRFLDLIGQVEHELGLSLDLGQ